MREHLAYEKHQPRALSNVRNGSSSKTLKSQYGEVEIATPRAHEGSFEPQLVKKQQTRLTQMDDQILSLYAKGMTTREIVATFKEMVDADVSPALISKVTNTPNCSKIRHKLSPITRRIRHQTHRLDQRRWPIARQLVDENQNKRPH